VPAKTLHLFPYRPLYLKPTLRVYIKIVKGILLRKGLGIGRNALYPRSLPGKETLLEILKLLMWLVFDCKTLQGIKFFLFLVTVGGNFV